MELFHLSIAQRRRSNNRTKKNKMTWKQSKAKQFDWFGHTQKNGMPCNSIDARVTIIKILYEISCCNIITFHVNEKIFQNKRLQMNLASIMTYIYKCELSIYFIHGIYGCTQVCLFSWMKFVHRVEKCITKFIHHTLNGWINEFSWTAQLFWSKFVCLMVFFFHNTQSTNIYNQSHVLINFQ
jgi:hypothetical protein